MDSKRQDLIIREAVVDSIQRICVNRCGNCLIDLGYILNHYHKDLGSIREIKVPFYCLVNGSIVAYKDWRVDINLGNDIPDYIIEKLDILYKIPLDSNNLNYPLKYSVLFEDEDRKDFMANYKERIDTQYILGFYDMSDTFKFFVLTQLKCYRNPSSGERYYKSPGIITYEEDEVPDDIIRLYKERHKSNEADEIMRIRLLGIYCSNGYGNHKGEPCVVLFPKNISKSAKDKNERYNLKMSDDDAINALKEFVEIHELAHAFFDLKNDSHLSNGHLSDCNMEIEECLANYVALLRAKKLGKNKVLDIGKVLVEDQASLTFNLGYNYALQLFDNNFEPQLTGWWKWRYCSDLIDEASYQNLSKIKDLSEILDIKGLSFS